MRCAMPWPVLLLQLVLSLWMCTSLYFSTAVSGSRLFQEFVRHFGALHSSLPTAVPPE